MKKNSAFQLRSGNKPSPAELSGVSPMKNDSKKAAKALGLSLTKIAEKIKGKKKTLPKPGDDSFVNPIDRSTEEEKKFAFENIPFLGPAKDNPKSGSLINTPKLGK